MSFHHPLHQVPTSPQQEQEESVQEVISDQEQDLDSVQEVPPVQEQDSVQDVTPPSTTPSSIPTSRTVPCTFNDCDIRVSGRNLTKEECYKIGLDKSNKAKACGRAELGARPKQVTFNRSSTPSSTSSSPPTCRPTSTPPVKTRSLVSHLPLPTPVQPPKLILKRTTCCEAYRGPPVDSKEYSRLQPLMAPSASPAPPTAMSPAPKPPHGIKFRLGYKPTNVKSRLGTRPPQGTDSSSQAPAISTSTTSPGLPAP